MISGSTEAGATVDVYVDGELVATTTADENGEWSVEVDEELEDGEREVTVTATDEAGNTTVVQRDVYVDVTGAEEPEEPEEPIDELETSKLWANACPAVEWTAQRRLNRGQVLHSYWCWRCSPRLDSVSGAESELSCHRRRILVFTSPNRFTTHLCLGTTTRCQFQFF